MDSEKAPLPAEFYKTLSGVLEFNLISARIYADDPQTLSVSKRNR